MFLSDLSAYLLLATSTGLLAGIASEAAHPRLRESVEWVSGLLVILSLVAPVLGLVASPPAVELPSLDADGEGLQYIEAVTAALEKGIAEELALSFSLDGGEVWVECGEVDPSVMRCASVTVVLTSSPSKANFTAIRGHVLENYVTDGGKCDVRWKYE